MIKMREALNFLVNFKNFSLPLVFAIFTLISAAPVFAQQSDIASEAQTLIDILENDEARGVLINSLREVAAPSVSGANNTIGLERVSLGRQIAQLTSEFMEAGAASLSSAVLGLISVTTLISSLDSSQFLALGDALIALAVVLISTLVSYFFLRKLSKRAYRKFGSQSKDLDIIGTVAIFIATVIIDALVVILSWGFGYFAALYLHGDPGVMGVRQSLYLNAFLIVGLVKVLVRAILSPTTQELRFVPMSDASAQNLSFWMGSIATLIGYGQLMFVPIVNQQASFSAGRGISTLLAFIAIFIMLSLILRNRESFALWVLGEKPESRSIFVKVFAKLWYVPVLAYLFFLAIIVAARPDGLILPVLLSTLKVAGVIFLGFLTSGILARFVSSGVRIPSTLQDRMPLLQDRVNSLLSKVSFALRVIIVVFVLGMSLDYAGAFGFREFLLSDFGRAVVGATISVGLIVLFGILAWLSLVSWIDYRLNPEYGASPTSREKTLLTLLRNAGTIALSVVIAMFALSELGVDIAPLIASAGVLGLAIGFGAQKLVQDIITGIFIQFENAINVGDVVTLGGTTGTAEKLTIRSITLRDVNGTVHLIPFSSVDMVSNYVRDFSYFVCDLGIAYRESIDEGRDAMMYAFDLLREGEHGPFIVGELEWFGVQALGDSAVVLRARIKCAPGKQWAIGRAYNEICKRILDDRGIEIPYPHQTIYFGENKDGSAPALHLRNARGMG